MDPLQDWEIEETRGFVTRNGYRKALGRKRKPGVPQETRGRNKYSASVGSAGGHGCPSSSCCKTGRHRGIGGCRSLKKSKGSLARSEWREFPPNAQFGAKPGGMVFTIPERGETRSKPRDDNASSLERGAHKGGDVPQVVVQATLEENQEMSQSEAMSFRAVVCNDDAAGCLSIGLRYHCRCFVRRGSSSEKAGWMLV